MVFCIINANPGGNKGAEAMLLVLIKKLASLNGVEKILIEKPIPPNSPILNKFLSLDKRLQYFNYNPRKFRAYDLKFSEINYIIDISGISFVDGSVRATIRKIIKYIPIFFNLEKVIFFTQDFGPTNNFFNKFFCSIILRRSKSVFARSSFSKTQILSISNKINCLGIFPDSTFALKKNNTSPMKINKKYVIFSPSSIMYNKHGESYKKLFIDLYNYLNKDYLIVYLVHNYTKNGKTSDSELIISLHNECKKSVIVNDQQLLADDYKSIISECSFSVTSRYHVLVGTMSQSIPSIAIGWNPKYDSFLDMYQMKRFSIFFDKNSLLSCKKIIDELKFNSHIEKKIDDLNRTIKTKVDKSFKLLFNQFHS